MKTFIPRSQQNRTLNSGERQVSKSVDEIDKWHKWRYDIVVLSMRKGDKVLDVGCGIGYGTRAIAVRADKVIGIDDSQETIAYAKENYAHERVVYACCDAEADTTTLEKNCVDVSVMFEVLEHFQDAMKVLKKVADATKRMMFISVPHVSVDLEKSDFHYRHYTKEDVEKMVAEVGFEIKQCELLDFSKGKAVFCVAERKNP